MKQVDLQGIAPGAARVGDSVSRNNRARNGNFEQILTDSLNKVNSMQLEANEAVKQLAAGRKENIHETMIAVQKASISFQMMMQIRNKIVEAYKELEKTI